jgi:phosphoesterase RecJ-like protein
VRCAVFAKESKDRVKMSFRSVGTYSVRDFAAQHFDGGGHHNAAGGATEEPIGVVMARLRGLLPEIAAGIEASLNEE